MKKSTLAAVIIIIIILGGGALFALTNKKDDEKDTDNTAPTTSTPSSETTTPPANNQQTESQTPAQAGDVEVEIEDMAFQSSNITVKKGAKVTWTNKDSVQHNVRADNPSSAFPGQASSELLSKDESYSFTFNTVGTFAYHCGPHPQMTATVTVTD